jgi:class 3 adenylate cyclase
VLFSDLSGFTTLSEKLDPEEARDVMARIFASAAETVGRYQGQVEKFIGDAIMAIFGATEAHEDDPSRAIRAALEIHQAVAEQAPELERRIGIHVAMHSGINTGVVVTGELQFDRGTAGPVGDTINTAARLMSLAGPGEVYIGPETLRAVATAFEVEDLGLKHLKGKDQLIPVARIIGYAPETRRARRRHGKFVGRQEEVGILLGAVERLLDGEGDSVAVCGGAGTGKTRLFAELRQRLGPDTLWIEGRAYPYTEDIPFFIFSDLLNWSWQIRESDSPDRVESKVRRGLTSILGQSGDDLPVIARLYGLDIEGASSIDRESYRQRLFDTMSRLLGSLARARPTIVCMQDLHCADASSLSLIHRLLAEPPGPVLFLCNYRPGPEMTDVSREITLSELSPRQTHQLVTSLLEDQPPADELIELVENQAEGNPFFIEELVSALRENARLVRTNGTWTLSEGGEAIPIPSTIRGLIAARIDALDEDSRRVLRVSAVLGREFREDVLRHLIPSDSRIRLCLDTLVNADLLRTKRVRGERVFEFKHALTQEVAYAGLLHTERSEWHRRAAVAMEARLSDRLPEFVEMLALHFSRAGVTDKAVHYLIEAGRKATSRYALDEAASHLRQAYELLAYRARSQSENEALVELLVEWTQVLHYQDLLEEMTARLLEYESVAEDIVDQELRGIYVAWIGHALYFNHDLLGAVEKLERAELIGAAAGNDRVVAYANAWKTYPLWFLGREAEGLEAGAKALPLAERIHDDPYLLFIGQAGAAGAAAASGDLGTARAIGEGLLEFAEYSGNARAAVAGLCCISSSQALQYDFDAAVQTARKAKARAVDPFYLAWATFYEALGLSWGGRVAESRVAIDALRLNASCFWKILVRPLHALTLMNEGHLSEGVVKLTDELDRLQRTGSQFMECFCRTVIARMYTDIVCREVSWELSTVIRNPGFFTRHVWGAGRKARAWLEEYLTFLDKSEVKVAIGFVCMDMARLEHYQHNPAKARENLLRALRLFDTQGAYTGITKSRSLAAKLGINLETTPGHA